MTIAITGIVGLFSCFVGLSGDGISQGKPLSTPTTPPGEVHLLLDRFGDVSYDNHIIEPTELIARIRTFRGQGASVVLDYEPVSFASDRQRLSQRLNQAFADQPIPLRPLTGRSMNHPRVFPEHDSAIQRQVLSGRKTLGKEFYVQHLKLLDHVRDYVGTILDQIARTRNELKLRHRELQRITTRTTENHG